jgi:hypothetical protein
MNFFLGALYFLCVMTCLLVIPLMCMVSGLERRQNKMALTIDDLVTETNDIKTQFDAFKQTVADRDTADAAAIADLKAQLATAIASGTPPDLAALSAALDALKADVTPTVVVAVPTDGSPVA